MGDVKIHEGLVPRFNAFVVIVDAVMMLAVAVDAFRIRVLVIKLVMLLAVKELVKRATVENVLGIKKAPPALAVEMYPKVPNP